MSPAQPYRPERARLAWDARPVLSLPAWLRCALCGQRPGAAIFLCARSDEIVCASCVRRIRAVDAWNAWDFYALTPSARTDGVRVLPAGDAVAALLRHGATISPE